MSNSPHNQVFEQARDEFLASLSPSEKSTFLKCSSLEILIADVTKSTSSKRDGSGKRVLASINALGSSLKPYFDTISIFVQSHPEYAAIVWGAFHLVFKLAENYTSFFSKVAKTLDRIVQVLPHYSQVANLSTKGPSASLRSSLCTVYKDLLRFCQSLLRVFSKEDGKSKHSVRIATGLMWKPFDTRFEEILDDFRFHADIVKSELLRVQLLESREGKGAIASQIQALQETLRKQEQVRAARDATYLSAKDLAAMEVQLKRMKNEKVQDIQAWIRPPPFIQEYERALDQKEPNTAEWLLSEDVTAGWKAIRGVTQQTSRSRRFDARTLWIQGNPGCGKTVLAASTIEELSDARSRSDQEPQVFYFFFKAGLTECNDPAAPLRSFLAQLFHTKRNDMDIIDRFAFIMEESSLGSLVAARSALLELLQLCIDRSGNVIFVIDGVDECDDPEAVVKDLIGLSNEANVKLLMFSRPNVSALFKTVPEQQRLNIKDKNNMDIEVFVNSKLDEMVDEKLLPSNVDLPQLRDHLILGANGMFLWIRLMVSFLNSPAITRRQRSEAIMNILTPEGLESMYDRIALLIRSGHSAERCLARHVFTWLLHAQRSLTTQELQVAISQNSGSQPFDEDEFADFTRGVIMSCAGLVEIQTTTVPTHGSDMLSFQFIHLSVREYLTSNEMNTNRTATCAHVSCSCITISRSESLSGLADKCLSVLSYNLPTQPLSGSLDSDTTKGQVHVMFPLVGYAICHWVDHLEQAWSHENIINGRLTVTLNSFQKFLSLKRTLMAFIEASYVFRTPSVTNRLDNIRRNFFALESEAGFDHDLLSKLADDTSELARYLSVLEKEWAHQLIQSPKAIWEEVTAFTKSWLVEQTGHTQLHTLIMEPPESQSISSRYLSKISELSADGKTVAILSIWPSKAFEQSAQSSMRPVESMIHVICTDWVARYELWSVSNNPQCIADGCIPLDANEIHLQFQRSMWQDNPAWAAGFWRMQLPIAVSPDTRLICIIRTVYLFTVSKRNEATMHAVVLPLKLKQYRGAIWPELPDTKESLGTNPSAEETSRSASGGFRRSLSGLLKPGSTHKRSKSLNREATPKPNSSSLEVPQTRSGLWSKSFSRPRTPNGTSSFSDHRRYRHWVCFANHGAHLLFVDHVQLSSSQRNDTPSNLVLFKLDTKDNLSVRRIQSTRAVFCPPDELPAPKFILHPNSDALSLFFPRVTKDSHVVMWYFDSRNKVDDVYQTAAHGWGEESIQDVHFSRDGDHIVIQTSTSEAPVVIPIFISYPGIASTTLPGVQSSDQALTTTSPSSPMIHLSKAPATNILNSSTSVTETGSASGLTLLHTGTQIAIRKWSQPGADSGASTQNAQNEVLQLTRLPAWGSMASSSAAISMPRRGDENIHIVLNKTARQWDDMVSDVDVNLPAIVARDMGTLKIEDEEGRVRRVDVGKQNLRVVGT
ncbi:hypothetical protein IQ07DRAFT_685759 [Pyrenochaeta sp. DS3sAY3a]|nr:hypothetical protein IQ07DRAFT_685759 [Pyrenochaeta sp. DS3sAY3a]